MPDPQPDPDSTLTRAEDDAVRALLASARHTAPTPPDVVARLDATLVSLGEERREARPETQTRAPVVTLATRRRRTGATVLLAAAAVVVLGVGIGQVLPSGTSHDSAGGTAETATSAEDQPTGESDRAFGADPSAGADEKQLDTSGRSAAESAPAPSSEALSDLTSDADLRRQARALRPAAFTSSYSGSECLVGAAPGDHISVTYDGRPAVLVYRLPVRGEQQVDVFVCGEPGPARSVRLRAP